MWSNIRKLRAFSKFLLLHGLLFSHFVQQNLVSKSTSWSSWIPHFNDFLNKMVEQQMIGCKQIILREKVILYLYYRE